MSTTLSRAKNLPDNLFPKPIFDFPNPAPNLPNPFPKSALDPLEQITESSACSVTCTLLYKGTGIPSQRHSLDLCADASF